MTGPLTFVPTPHPTLPNPCDGVDAFGDVSTNTRTNFDRVRAVLNPLPAKQIRYTTTSGQYGLVGSNGGWVNIPASQLAPVTITVPAKCQGILVSMSAEAVAISSADNTVWVGIAMSGAGYPAPPGNTWTAVCARNAAIGCTRHFIVAAGALALGKAITFQPVIQFWHGASAATCSWGPAEMTINVFQGV